MNSEEQTENGLPEEFRKYFWDCEFSEISFTTHTRLVAKRILNYGNTDSVRWLLSRINRQVLEGIVKKNRNLNNKTRNYWELVLLNTN